MSVRPLPIVLLFIVVIFGVAVSVANIWDTNYAGYVKLAQRPITGQLIVKPDPGLFWPLGGEVWQYKQSGTFSFSADRSRGDDSASSGPVEVRFNDGGIAQLSGNVRFELPVGSDTAMINIHKNFRSYDHIARTLVQPAVTEALILTASLMSAEESYSGRRAEFAQLAWDQVLHGVYLTEWELKETNDPVTGEKKSRRIVHIKLDAEGSPVRKPNSLEDYEIRITQFFLDKDLAYEPGVLQQISNQRDAMMKTVAAKAEAEKAQQDRLTAEAQGQALVMRAKYEAEVTKSKAVVEATQNKEVAETQAAQRFEVAKLDRDAAGAYRDAQILRAEGDSEYKRKVMAADGALEQKLAAWVDVNKRFAEAIQSYGGAWVPSVVMGSGQGGAGNGAASAIDLVNLLTAKTARDLSLDLGLGSAGKGAKPTP